VATLRASFFVVLLFCSSVFTMTSGCASIPQRRSAVDSVALRGAKELSASDVEEKMATMPSPKFLGLFRGVVYDYELFNRATLQRDLARVERFYRARGYYDAHAVAGLVLQTKERHVRVEVEVEEGPPVVNLTSKLEGTTGLPKEIVEAITRAAQDQLAPGEPFDEDKFEEAQNAVRKALTDRGYAYAKVDRDAMVDLVKHTALPVFTVAPDQPATFGKVVIEGRTSNSAVVDVEIPEYAMRRAIDIEEGSPYSTQAIEDATRALLDLEVFSAVEIQPDLPDPPPPTHVVPLKVRVEPNRLRHLRLGGGFEFDQLKTDLHALIGWEDKNFLGGLRSFRVDLKPGVVLYPLRLDNIVTPTRLLPEERLRLVFKQPGFLEARTNLVVQPEFNIFPLLVRASDETAASIVGYREVKGATWLDRSYGNLYSSVGYNIQIENPFTYKGPLADYLSTLVISYPEVIARLDFRDDRIHPRKGVYLAANFQYAGGPFGGNAGDMKTQPEVRAYVPVASGVTVATRASLGFLFPRNYGDIVRDHLTEDITDDNQRERTRDIQTVLFRGFYSGGPSSNRGYPTRGIAPHGVIPFLNPATASQQVATRCDDPKAVDFDYATCAVPIGGFTLWEFSTELRFQVTGPLSAAIFVDMGDVSERTTNIRLARLHLSTGVGARYDTPVGPIRLDIGYRVQPLQVLGFRNEDDLARQDPVAGLPPKLLGVPIAIAFGIGEAY
jgi:outer membrane protein insertion porin family/translocation and assembly module TamA